MFFFVGVVAPFCVCEKLQVCKVGAVEMGCAKHFGHVGNHGFILDVKRLCVLVDPLEDIQLCRISGWLEFWRRQVVRTSLNWNSWWCNGRWRWCLFGGMLGCEKWVGFECDARGTVG